LPAALKVAGIARIERDGLVEIGDGAIGLALGFEHEAATVVGRATLRCEADRGFEIRERLVRALSWRSTIRRG